MERIIRWGLIIHPPTFPYGHACRKCCNICSDTDEMEPCLQEKHCSMSIWCRLLNSQPENWLVLELYWLVEHWVPLSSSRPQLLAFLWLLWELFVAPPGQCYIYIKNKMFTHRKKKNKQVWIIQYSSLTSLEMDGLILDFVWGFGRVGAGVSWLCEETFEVFSASAWACNLKQKKSIMGRKMRMLIRKMTKSVGQW